MKKRRRVSTQPFWRRLSWPAWAAPWKKHLLVATAIVASLFLIVFTVIYVQYGREIDARLHGERDRVVPRVFARPLTLEPNQSVTLTEVIERLNDAGYAQRARVERQGEFTVDKNVLSLMPRGGDQSGHAVQATFATRVAKKGAPEIAYRINRLTVDGKPAQLVTLDPPLLTALMTGPREKRRRVALNTIPSRMQQAVLAIEDRRFYAHPGVDPIRMIGALVTNVTGDRPYLVGASTITQQLARNFFLSEEMAEEQQSRQRSLRRKLQEQFMAVILETKATKDEILELYLNDVYLGHRGSFALHGVAEAARIFFAKDVSNLSLSEAAMIAGIIQSPSNHSPFNNLARAKERRDVVLRAMVDASYITKDAADRAASEPVKVTSGGVENEAPYFVDYLRQALDTVTPGVTERTGALDIYSTIDLSLQRYAQDAVREGLGKVDAVLSRRKRGPRRVAQAALVAIEPKTGEIVAMIGGRSYNQSQFNRAVSARRQPGSTFKPFVYLTAFEGSDSEVSLTPASIVRDEPTTWTVNNEEWSPHNFDEEYEGDTTLRRAFTMSRNIAAIKVAEQAGFARVAALWKRTKVGETELRGYPSIALGVFEVTPLELAEAYTLFPNGGTIQPLTAIARVVSGKEVVKPIRPAGARVARATSSYLMVDMMRGVLNEGTGYGARAAGFTLDAAGKTGTSNDLRDAWFVGFTPELLTVVWVGLDDNQPLGLSGAQAALPIWTSFMMKALAGHPNVTFHVPEGLKFAQIDRDTGMLAGPNCPHVSWVAFLEGTEPTQDCDIH